MEVKSGSIIDFGDENIVKVYPYLLPNVHRSKTFSKPNGSSIVGITQDGLDKDLLEVDPQGRYYFEMFVDKRIATTLDYASHTSTVGQRLTEETRLDGVANFFPKDITTQLKLGNTYITPMVFTIGESYFDTIYMDGDQAVFMAGSITEAKEALDGKYIDKEGYYALNLVNVKVIENQLNARLQFTLNHNHFKEFGFNQNFVTLEVEKETLLGGVKVFGEMSYGLNVPNEHTSVDMKSIFPMIPIRMRPSLINNEVTMYCDWMDYSIAMPWFIAKDFAAGGTIDSAIEHLEDRKAFFDILTVSAGYASSWVGAKLGTDGKIDPTWTIGYSQLKPAFMVNQTPKQVIDGIMEAHIRNNPAFIYEENRQERFTMCLAALSRYVHTSYAIASGLTDFHAAYLPWYLEPLGAINYTHTDGGYIGVDPNIKFRLRSMYFMETFSTKNVNKVDFEIDPTKPFALTVPKHPEITKPITVQTSRKIDLPEIPAVLAEVNTSAMAGDINPNDANSLAYLWWIPDSRLEFAKNIFLSQANSTVIHAAGSTLNITLPPTEPGTILTKAQIEAKITAQYPGATLPADVTTYATEVWTDQGKGSYKNPTKAYRNIRYRDFVETFKNNAGFPDMTEAELAEYIRAHYGYAPGSVEVTGTTETDGSWHFFTVKMKNQAFRPITITLAQDVTTDISFKDRRVSFNRAQWKQLMTDNHGFPTNTDEILLQPKPGWVMHSVDKILITALWGSYVELRGRKGNYKVPLFNEEDETITQQWIIFT